MSLPIDSAERKRFPLHDGLIAYFPEALAMVARVSYDGNEKHNPGEPLHWARGKSMDQKDCLLRHLVDAAAAAHRAEIHQEIYERAQVAWRALAELELKIEAAGGLAVLYPGDGK